MNRPCFLPWFCRRSNRRREPSRSLRQPGRRTLEAPAPWEWRMNMIVETADDDHCYSPIGACWLQGKGRDIPHSLQRCRNPDINNNFIIITNNNIDSSQQHHCHHPKCSSFYSYKPWVMMSACCWGGAVLHKWQWPKLGLEWPPREPSPLVAFPDCVSTHRSDYSTHSPFWNFLLIP